MIKVLNLKKSYGHAGARVEVLKGVDLEIQEGETVALVGKSGSGKSTLLSLMAGLDRPDHGEIYVHGKNLNQLSEKELTLFRAQNMGIVFQQFHLISTLTAFENVSLPLMILQRSEAEQKARQLINEVGLSHRSDHLPSQLSGGEGQRVALARALSSGPSILFADEPSGNLDEETGERVMDLMFELVKKTKTTLILVTHDKELAKRCSRIVTLEHGSLV